MRHFGSSRNTRCESYGAFSVVNVPCKLILLLCTLATANGCLTQIGGVQCSKFLPSAQCCADSGLSCQPLLGCYHNPRLFNEPCTLGETCTGDACCSDGLACRTPGMGPPNTGKCRPINDTTPGVGITVVGGPTASSPTGSNSIAPTPDALNKAVFAPTAVPTSGPLTGSPISDSPTSSPVSTSTGSPVSDSSTSSPVSTTGTDSAAETSAPSAVPTPAMTQAPTPGSTQLTPYDVTYESTEACPEGSITATVTDSSGDPVVGTYVDFLLLGPDTSTSTGGYSGGGVTDANGTVTYEYTVDLNADGGKALWCSMAMDNPSYPAGLNQQVPCSAAVCDVGGSSSGGSSSTTAPTGSSIAATSPSPTEAPVPAPVPSPTVAVTRPVFNPPKENARSFCVVEAGGLGNCLMWEQIICTGKCSFEDMVNSMGRTECRVSQVDTGHGSGAGCGCGSPDMCTCTISGLEYQIGNTCTSSRGETDGGGRRTRKQLRG